MALESFVVSTDWALTVAGGTPLATGLEQQLAAATKRAEDAEEEGVIHAGTITELQQRIAELERDRRGYTVQEVFAIAADACKSIWLFAYDDIKSGKMNTKGDAYTWQANIVAAALAPLCCRQPVRTREEMVEAVAKAYETNGATDVAEAIRTGRNGPLMIAATSLCVIDALIGLIPSNEEQRLVIGKKEIIRLAAGGVINYSDKLSLVAAEHLVGHDPYASDEEVKRLREAIKDAGFSVMQTSGKWSIHDVSEKGKVEEAKSLAVATENVELKIEVKRLREANAKLQREVDDCELCRDYEAAFSRLAKLLDCEKAEFGNDGMAWLIHRIEEAVTRLQGELARERHETDRLNNERIRLNRELDKALATRRSVSVPSVEELRAFAVNGLSELGYVLADGDADDFANGLRAFLAVRAKKGEIIRDVNADLDKILTSIENKPVGPAPIGTGVTSDIAAQCREAAAKVLDGYDFSLAKALRMNNQEWPTVSGTNSAIAKCEELYDVKVAALEKKIENMRPLAFAQEVAISLGDTPENVAESPTARTEGDARPAGEWYEWKCFHHDDKYHFIHVVGDKQYGYSEDGEGPIATRNWNVSNYPSWRRLESKPEIITKHEQKYSYWTYRPDSCVRLSLYRWDGQKMKVRTEDKEWMPPCLDIKPSLLDEYGRSISAEQAAMLQAEWGQEADTKQRVDRALKDAAETSAKLDTEVEQRVAEKMAKPSQPECEKCGDVYVGCKECSGLEHSATPEKRVTNCDIIGGFPSKSPNCAGCGKPLTHENAGLTDGCHCNTPLGVNSMNETRWRLLLEAHRALLRQAAEDRELAEAMRTKLKTLGAAIHDCWTTAGGASNESNQIVQAFVNEHIAVQAAMKKGGEA